MDGGEEEEELNRLRDYMTVIIRTPSNLRPHDYESLACMARCSRGLHDIKERLCNE